MGTCTLNFDQIHIDNKRSDTAHSDNDWLIATWFVGPNHVRTDTVQLNNAHGSPILDTGDTIQPISLGLACADSDLVSVTYVTVNLGSLDFSDQIKAAGDIGQDIAKKLTELYVKAAELYVRYNPEIPLNQVWADAIEYMSPYIVDTVGLAWDDVLIPVVDGVVEYLQALFGRPDCNGDVFHDLVVFDPSWASATESWSRTYSAHSPSACGADPHTTVRYTRERSTDPVFSPSGPPRVDFTEAAGAPGQAWAGTWVDSPTSTTPSIRVSVESMPLGFGSDTAIMAVALREQVDPGVGGLFEASANPLMVQSATVFPYQGDNFGILKRRKRGVSPRIDLGMVGDSAAVAASLVSTVAATEIGGIGDPIQLTVDVESLVLSDVGVTLTLYTSRAGGSFIGYRLRYTRADSSQYTCTDVMLAPWSPVH
jgi:hypothetical protein